MIRRILVPVEPSDFFGAALETACTIARSTGAQVVGLGIVDEPGIERALGGAPAGAIYYAEKAVEHYVEEARKKLMELFEKFRAGCERHGVSWSQQELVGDPIDLLFEESKYHDLVVTGLRTSLHFATEETPEKNLDEILRHTATPVLAVPARVPSLARVLVAYDGSLPAARSFQRFVQFLGAGVEKMTVLNVTDDRDQGTRLLAKVKDYLNAHGITATMAVEQGEISEVVETQYAGRADLVVLGMHSKIPVVDLIVGSLTKHLIRKGDVALFLSH